MNTSEQCLLSLYESYVARIKAIILQNINENISGLQLKLAL